MPVPGLRALLGIGLVGTGGALVVALGFDAGCTVFNGASAMACTSSAQGYVSLAQAARACQLIASCSPDATFMQDIESSIGVVTSATNFAYCMNALAGSVPQTRPGNNTASAAFACIAAATSCSAARACVGVETFDPAHDARCTQAHAGSVYCANGGNDIVDCTDAGGEVVHCAQPPFDGEGTCVIDPNDPTDYFCGDNEGGGPGCSACDIGTSLLTTCVGGTHLEGYVVCADLGQTCGTGATAAGDAGDASEAADGGGAGMPACVTQGTLAPCDPNTYQDQCVDGSIGTCNWLSSISTTDCRALGATCVQGDQPYCDLPGATCTPFSPGVGACNGPVLALCVDGKPLSFDCRCAGMHCQDGACAP